MRTECEGCTDTECALSLAKAGYSRSRFLDHSRSDVTAPGWPRTWGLMIDSQGSWRHAESLIKLNLHYPISSESVSCISWFAFGSPDDQEVIKEREARDRCWLLLAGKSGVIMPSQALETLDRFGFNCDENRRMKLLAPVFSSWNPLLADPEELNKAAHLARPADLKVQALLGDCLGRELQVLELVISQSVPKCPSVLVKIISHFLIPLGWESFLAFRTLVQVPSRVGD